MVSHENKGKEDSQRYLFVAARASNKTVCMVGSEFVAETDGAGYSMEDGGIYHSCHAKFQCKDCVYAAG